MAERILEYSDSGEMLLGERIVRCKDCKHAASMYGSADYLDCMGPLAESWDYYNDQPKENPVPYN